MGVYRVVKSLVRVAALYRAMASLGFDRRKSRLTKFQAKQDKSRGYSRVLLFHLCLHFRSKIQDSLQN